MRAGNTGGRRGSGPEIKRPLQTIGCSGRLTTATLPILTKEPTVANLIFRLIGTLNLGRRVGGHFPLSGRPGTRRGAFSVARKPQ